MGEVETLFSSSAKYPKAERLLLLTSRLNTFGRPRQHADGNQMCRGGQICLNVRRLLRCVWACVASTQLCSGGCCQRRLLTSHQPVPSRVSKAAIFSEQQFLLLLLLLLELEEESPIINWSLELGTRLDSRLYALWNRTAGDCLLDSVLQATWGIYDKDSVLRKTLHDSLHDCSHW